MKNDKPDFIDIHSHLQFPVFNEDLESVIERAFENKTWVINVGTNFKTSSEAVDIAERYSEGMYAIIGLHPIYTNKSFQDEDGNGEDFDREKFEELIKNPKVVGVGECGLDFFRIEGDREENIQKQKEIFEAQIDLAAKYDKPLMIHCRDAYPEVLEILSKKKSEYGDKVRANFHFFAGSLEDTQKILDLGFNFSFTGVITFAKDYEKLVKMAPIERIFSETDCPYVAPVPHRGKRNEPVFVSEVVKKIAEIKELDYEEVKRTLVQNALDFFGIK